MRIMSMDENNFNQAEHYEKDSSIQREDGHKIIDLLAPKKGMKILDLGCGTGYFSKFLADLVGPDGQVVGVDPDGERIKVARNKYTASNLKYIEGGVEMISESDYDIVFSNYVLHWIKDKDPILKQVIHCLKKGGRFAFLADQSYSKLMVEFLSVNSQSKELIQRMEERVFFVSEDFKQKLISIGSDINHWAIVDHSWIFDDPDAFMKFFKTHHGSIEKGHFESLKTYSNWPIIIDSQHIIAVVTKV